MPDRAPNEPWETPTNNPADGVEVSIGATAAQTRAAPQARRRAVAAWALWDWGSSAYSTIVTSFVFAPYLTGVVARTARQAHSAAKLGLPFPCSLLDSA